VKRERIAGDYYATPAWATELILDELWLPTNARILDPSAGEGAILDVAAAQGFATIGYELDAERARVCGAKHPTIQCDALGPETWCHASAIVGNPPFGKAQEFAEKAAQWAEAHGTVAALLLRLAFAESKSRVEFHRSYPSALRVLSERPRFRVDTRGTDSSAYAWFVWDRRYEVKVEGWRVLARKEGAQCKG